MKLLYQAGGLIERDALVSRLKSEGIEPYAPDNDISSRRVTPSVIDISLGEASAFLFKGFAVYVPDHDFEKAQNIMQEWQRDSTDDHSEWGVNDTRREARGDTRGDTHAESAEPLPWRNFYLYAFATLVLPGPTHLLAAWEFIKNVHHLSKVRPIYFTFALFLLAITGVLWGATLYNYLSQ